MLCLADWEWSGTDMLRRDQENQIAKRDWGLESESGGREDDQIPPHAVDLL